MMSTVSEIAVAQPSRKPREFRVTLKTCNPHEVMQEPGVPQLGSTRDGLIVDRVNVTPLEGDSGSFHTWHVEIHEIPSGRQSDGSFVLLPEAAAQLGRVMLVRGLQIMPEQRVFEEVAKLADIILEKQGVEFAQYSG